MKYSKRTAAVAGIVLVCSLAGAGVYRRISSHGTPADSTAATDSAALAAGTGTAFDTDLPIPVGAAEVVRDTLVLSVSAAGEAASFRSTQLRAQVAGQVRSVSVGENAGVGETQVVVEIDPTEYELNLQEARANRARIESSYREQLVFDDRISDPAVRAERERNARARTGLDGAEAAVRKAELNLERTRVRAPFAGRVANLRVVRGQYVSPGDELLTVQQMDPLKVEVQVLESEVGFLAPGRRAALSFAAFPGETFAGTVESINPVVDQKTRTARVSVAVRNGAQRLLPGMYARVALAAQRLPGRILVPRSALLERDHRTMLFVFEGENDVGLAKWRYVTPGLQNDSLVEIVENPETEMVRPGERVLTAGHNTLNHDARIRISRDLKAEEGRPR